MDKLHDYWLALERLVKNEPIRVPLGTKISNDAVSQEAGRGKGSIKRGRAAFTEIIRAIDNTRNAEDSQEGQGRKAVADEVNSKHYKKLYYESLEREVALLCEIHELQQQINKLKNQ